MITKRLALLWAVLVLGLSCIFVLPKRVQQQPVGIVMDLPASIGEWYGEPAQVTQKERDVLGKETEFCRKRYFNGLGDSIYVSLVLGGQDMNTSIHRPERCLPAQGFTIVDSRLQKIPLSPRPLTVTRLHNMRPRLAQDGSAVQLPNGKPATEFNLNYYWFVGCSETTPSHNARNLIDIRDRLLEGYNQRWAYITVSSEITGALRTFGRSEKETDAIIQQFLLQLVPLIQQPGVVNR